jgi:hypothetical protein
MKPDFSRDSKRGVRTHVAEDIISITRCQRRGRKDGDSIISGRYRGAARYRYFPRPSGFGGVFAEAEAQLISSHE